MTSLNKLGLTVVLITGLVLAVLFAAWWGIQHYFLKSETPSPTPATADVSQDTDGDGLADLVENLYKTDPNKADTDGDQVSDGDEVRAGRNPTLAEALGASGTLPLGSQVAEANTWTQKYLASLPEDTPQDQVLDQTRLEAFVNVNKGQLLPTLPEGLIKTTSVSGKEAIKTYLDAISPVQNKNLSAVSNQDIETAWRLAYQNNQPETINGLIQKLHNNVDVLEEAAVPQELAELHTKVVASAHSLTNNTERLRDMNKDFVGGLIGAKSIEELAAVFAEIEAEVKELDVKYGF